MRGYSEFKGIIYRFEFDSSTQSFIYCALKSSPVSPAAQGETWHEGEGKSPPVSLAFIPKQSRIGQRSKFPVRIAKTG